MSVQIRCLRLSANWKFLISSILIIILFQSCKYPYAYLSRRNMVECANVGFKPIKPSKVYLNYERFRDVTSNEKLKKYLSSRNIVIKTYSYLALIEKLESGYLEIMDLALRDTNQIGVKCGCTVDIENISHRAYMNYFEKQNFIISYKDEESIMFKIENEKLYRLDSLIITNSIKSEELLMVILNDREFTDEKILDSIIDLALFDNSVSAKKYIKNNFNRETSNVLKSKLQKLKQEVLPENSIGFLREINLK